MPVFSLIAGLLPKKSNSSRRAGRTATRAKTRSRLPLHLEFLEDRQAPAVTASLTAGLLTVNFGATGDTGTVTGTAPTGSAISVTGTGLVATAFTGVSSIAVTVAPACD